jgi:hypothetical protein
VIEHQEETGKIDFAQQESDGRHDEAFNQRGDDLSEGCADDDRHGEIDDVSASQEFFEFFQHKILPGWDCSGSAILTLRGTGIYAPTINDSLSQLVSGTLSLVFVLEIVRLTVGTSSFAEQSAG